jgi:hypothetical protein
VIDSQQYLAVVAQRLGEDGFELTPNVSVGGQLVNLWAVRRKFQAGKFGTVSSFVVVRLDSSIDAAQLATYSAACFQAAMERTGGVRGLGSTGVCYSVSAVPQADPGLVATVASTPTVKHWSSFEFPAVVDLGSSTVTYFNKRVIWGAAYIRGFRRDAERWLKPAG